MTDKRMEETAKNLFECMSYDSGPGWEYLHEELKDYWRARADRWLEGLPPIKGPAQGHQGK